MRLAGLESADPHTDCATAESPRLYTYHVLSESLVGHDSRSLVFLLLTGGKVLGFQIFNLQLLPVFSLVLPPCLPL